VNEISAALQQAGCGVSKWNCAVALTRHRSIELRRGSPCLSYLLQAAGYSGKVNKECTILRIKIDRFLASEMFISFFYRLILFYSWTFRLKIENDKDWMDYRRNGGCRFALGLASTIFFCYSLRLNSLYTNFSDT